MTPEILFIKLLYESTLSSVRVFSQNLCNMDLYRPKQNIEAVCCVIIRLWKSIQMHHYQPQINQTFMPIMKACNLLTETAVYS